MHVALTDVLTCPRCGPGHGLILVPDEVRDRRVVSGVLGCADCRTRYRVEGGVADLVGEGGSVGEVGDVGVGREEAVRLGGLLGLAGVSGVVLLAGAASAVAASLSALVEGVEVVAMTGGSAPGVTAIRAGRALPFQSGKLKGVALTGGTADALLEEGARVVAPVARLLLDPAPAGAAARLEAAGLRVVASEGSVVVAAR